MFNIHDAVLAATGPDADQAEWHEGEVKQLRDDLSALLGSALVVKHKRFVQDFVYAVDMWYGVQHSMDHADAPLTWYPSSALRLLPPVGAL